MKTLKYIVEITMPKGDDISAQWLEDLIQQDCDVEDEGRQKVVVKKIEESVLASLLLYH